MQYISCLFYEYTLYTTRKKHGDGDFARRLVASHLAPLPFADSLPVYQTSFPSPPLVCAPLPSRHKSSASANSPSTSPLPPRTPPPHRFPGHRKRVEGA
ncbi:uncharacterized protein SCHCODRAFT_02644233 [Schizophyllum commune H4-8]|uniref:uncharacterized protein n=1 Tax=Schizophyllum commune (strain H4-8 / FGSC 9210) TaxID=578458 RepID=UPI0021604F2E|nr:uncharacterized protein SCHCODRAFT_02644233 [Schizophyllum commune H4-8]KAI5885252.1 hypothetical protein SCHCODRAFT_02644233 [Schizophyllum commune H4-8]